MPQHFANKEERPTGHKKAEGSMKVSTGDSGVWQRKQVGSRVPETGGFLYDTLEHSVKLSESR